MTGLFQEATLLYWFSGHLRFMEFIIERTWSFSSFISYTCSQNVLGVEGTVPLTGVNHSGV